MFFHNPSSLASLMHREQVSAEGKISNHQRGEQMSIQKKSLISTLRTTKKANVAREEFGEVGSPNKSSVTHQMKSEGLRMKSEGLRMKSDGLKMKSDGLKMKSEGLRMKSDGLKMKSAGLRMKSAGLRMKSQIR
jgi:hypothetical protein